MGLQAVDVKIGHSDDAMGTNRDRITLLGASFLFKVLGRNFNRWQSY